MVGAWTVYSNATLAMAEGDLDLATDNFNLILVKGAYAPAPNSDSTYANVSPQEVTGGGYTVGGEALASGSVILAGGTVVFNAVAPPWAAPFTATFRYGVIVRRASGFLAPGDLLLCFSDMGGGGSVTGAGGTATVAMDPAGILNITHTP